MAEFPDLLINPNPDAPTLDASGNQVRGINIFETTAERDALNATVRIPGALAVIKGSDELYQYTAETVDDTAWQDDANWLAVGSAGGSTTGIDLSLVVRDAAYGSIGDHEGTVLIIGVVAALAQVHYWDGAAWSLANASAAGTASGLLCMGTAANGDALVDGIMQLGAAPGAAGNILYLNISNGTLTAVAPTGSGEIVRVCGYNLGGNRVYFNPSKDWLELT